MYFNFYNVFVCGICSTYGGGASATEEGDVLGSLLGVLLRCGPCGILVDRVHRRGTGVSIARPQLAAIQNPDDRFLLWLRSNACLVWSGYKSERGGEEVGGVA